MSQHAKFIEKWVGYLNDIDHEMSLIAARKLGSAKDASAVPQLINSLSKRPDDVRIASARALGEIGDSSAVKALVNLLTDKNPLVASTAAESLGAIGHGSAVPALVKILSDYREGQSRHTQIHGFNRGLFMAAVFALERINTPEARRAVQRYNRA